MLLLLCLGKVFFFGNVIEFKVFFFCINVFFEKFRRYRIVMRMLMKIVDLLDCMVFLVMFLNFFLFCELKNKK